MEERRASAFRSRARRPKPGRLVGRGRVVSEPSSSTPASGANDVRRVDDFLGFVELRDDMTGRLTTGSLSIARRQSSARCH